MENSGKKTESPWYNTKEGIQESLKTLGGFNLLVKERYEAGYKRNETLNEFFVMGHFCLRETGSCELVRMQTNEGEITLPQNLLSQTEFEAYLEKHKSLSPEISYQNAFLPSPEEECYFCKKTWDIDNCHDLIKVSSDSCHPNCYAKHLEKAGRPIYEEMFHDTGFKIEKMVPVPRTLPNLTPLAPWFVVQTQFGEITIGWQDYCRTLDKDCCYSMDVTGLNLTDHINGTELYVQFAPINKDNNKRIIEASDGEEAQKILSIVFNSL